MSADHSNPSTRNDGVGADVVVIGAGPVGLALACELYRHGVPCRVVERAAAPSVWSKAAAVQARTLEVFRDMGIADRAVARGRPVHGFNLYTGEKRIAHVAIDLDGTPYPYILGLSQRDTELLLAERLAELGGRVDRGLVLRDLTHDDGGVTYTLARAGDRARDGDRDGDPDGDGTETVETARAAWLIGCDGARSQVRRSLDLPFTGSTFEQTLIQADIRVKFPFATDPDEAVVFLSPEGAIGALPVFEDGRYRLIAVAPPPELERLGSLETPVLAHFEALVRARCPAGTEVSDPAWMIGFRFHGRMVSAYRTGRVFLAGDAAHIHSPAGGQGMNMGIQDAYNLAWKLALVIRGAARPEILDSYHAERHPVASATVTGTDRTTRLGLRVSMLRNPIARALRDQAMSLLLNLGVVQRRLFRGIGGMEVDYAGSPIVGEHHISPLWTNVSVDRTVERPAIRDWLHFGRGPGPGARVPDLDLADDEPLPGEAPGGDGDGDDDGGDDGGGATLFDLLTGTRHVLLLFDGHAATPGGYRTLAAIAERVTARYRDLIDVHVVVPREERPGELPGSGSVILDPDGRLHAHFGAGAESLYLIRPDGYVGYRGQPADPDPLTEYLDAVLLPGDAETA